MMRVRGLAEVVSDLTGYGKNVRRQTIALTETTRRLIAYDAKVNVAVDTGQTRQNINDEAFNGGLGGAVFCNVSWAAYLEFGTGIGVLIPPGWEAFAAQFKGEGKRTVNIPAQPFLIPAWLKHKDNYINGIKRILQQ